LAPEGRNSCDDQVRFVPLHLALAGGDAPDDLIRFVLVHLAQEGSNSHDEQLCFAPKEGKPVERFGELDMGLLQSLQGQTGVGHWEVVTDRSA